MYVAATTTAVHPAAGNYTTLGIAANSRHGQWHPVRTEVQRRPETARRPGRVERLSGQARNQARNLAHRTRSKVARVKQRFVMAPWMAADE